MNSNSNESSDNENIPAKKPKVAYAQKYKEVWKLDYSWVNTSSKGQYFAWCEICKTDINISQGKSSLKRHSETVKHKTNNITPQIAPTVEEVQQSTSVSFPENFEEKVKEAEIKLALFIVEHNLPMKVMQHLSPLIASICPDSAIAERIKCGRLKMKNIISNVTGAAQKEYLFKMMRKFKFSIIADESTDRACIKHLCLVVRINNNNRNIEDYFLTLIPIQDASGASIFEKIITFFEVNQIPYNENLLGFASDGASNMVGRYNSVVSRLKVAVPNIFILKCVCHSFHLCANYACEKLPKNIEQTVKELYNYFSHSPKRQDEMKEFQEFANVPQHKILKLAQTRWLSLEAVVKRILSQYNALLLYFTDQATQTNIHSNQILTTLCNPEFKLYLEFLSYILPLFNRLNMTMQSEKPKIQILHDEITLTLRTILDCYIKPDIINMTSINDIDFTNSQNFLKLENMYFGVAISASKVSANVLDTVKLNCLQFYIEATQQILKRFPLQDAIYAKLNFMEPKHIIAKSRPSISDVAMDFPNLLHTNNIQEIDNEWRELRNTDLKDVHFKDDIIEFWQQIGEMKTGNGNLQFPQITNFVFNILCLPHSSAAVERIFSLVSLNKTQTRNRFKTATLEAILLTKDLVSRNGNCCKMNVTSDLVQRMQSHLLYGGVKTIPSTSNTFSNSDSE